MPNLTNHILTTGGQALIAQAHLGRKLVFTKIAVGSGNVTTPISATALAAHQMDVGITSIQRDATNANWVRVRGVFNNVSLTTGFNYREMGLFARIDSEPEVLYSYVADAGIGDLIPAYDGANPVIVYPTLIVIIESTIPIHADITIGADFDCENIGDDPFLGWDLTDSQGVYAARKGNTFLFKRIWVGHGLEIVGEEGPEGWIEIKQKILEVDLDLYVPLTHPAAPRPEVAFPTIQAAWDHLKGYSIPSDRTATINVAAGTFPSPQSIYLEHPQGNQIRLIGTGPAPSTGVNYPTTLTFSGNNGISIGKNGIGRMENFTISGGGGGAGYGLAISSTPANPILCNLHLAWWTIGLYVSGSGVSANVEQRLYTPSNSNGITITNGASLLAANATINSSANSSRGIWAAAGVVTMDQSHFEATSNGESGVIASENGMISFRNTRVITTSNGYGFYADYRGLISSLHTPPVANQVTMHTNNIRDGWATQGGYILIKGNDNISLALLPANNTMGPDGSFLSVES